jgi:LPS O-antigen subunit length determinant protein (WzzB/FepE family)
MRSDRAMSAFLYAKTSLETLQNEIKVLEDSMQYLQEKGVYSYKDQIAYLTEQYGTAIVEGHPDRAQEIKVQMDFLSKYGTRYKKIESEIDGGYEKMQILRKRYDLMKIDVESNISSHLVVDKAAAADKKSYPIRWLIVVVSAMATFVFGVVVILVRDNIEKLKKA